MAHVAGYVTKLQVEQETILQKPNQRLRATKDVAQKLVEKREKTIVEQSSQSDVRFDVP